MKQLETERLLLRPLVPGDAPGLLDVLGDPKVMAAFGEQPFGPLEVERWLQTRLDHWRRYGVGLFAITLNDSDEAIGDCGLEHMELDGSDAVEMGYDLASAYWNRGLATEAAKAVLDFAANDLKLAEVVSMIRVGNQASRRVAEKAGMALTRDIRHAGIDYWLFARIL